MGEQFDRLGIGPRGMQCVRDERRDPHHFALRQFLPNLHQSIAMLPDAARSHRLYQFGLVVSRVEISRVLGQDVSDDEREVVR